jgi:hypothetical protein
MRHRAVYCCGLLAITMPGLSLNGQTAQELPKLSVTADTTVAAAGKPVQLKLQLSDQTGAPIFTDRDLQFNVEAPGAKPDQSLVVIPKGQTSALLNVRSDSPGVSSVTFEPASASSALAQTSAQVAFSPGPDYKPRLPLSLLLRVLPGSKLRATLDKAELILLVVDQSRVPVPAPHLFVVRFPGLDEVITPFPLNIEAGSPEATAVLATQVPGNYELNPVVVPPISVLSDAPTLVFENPVAGLRILADPSYVKAVFRPHVPIKAGLYDVRGNSISTDHDLTVILRVDPLGAGRLTTSQFTLPRGNSTIATIFTPSDEGRATISALTEKGLNIEVGQLEFHYAFTLFVIVALIGGIAGGIVRNALQSATPPRGRYILGILAAAFFGVLAFILAPVIVSVSFKPEVLQNSSKLFEAFLWGFIGGGTGAKLFEKVFPNVGKQAPGTVHA